MKYLPAMLHNQGVSTGLNHESYNGDSLKACIFNGEGEYGTEF